MRAIKTRSGVALLAATFIGVSVFTAQGGQMYWTVNDNLLGDINVTADNHYVDFVERINFYLIPFLDYGSVFAGLTDDNPIFDDRLAFASLTLGGFSVGSPPSVTSLESSGGHFDPDTVPTEFFLLALVCYETIAPGVFSGTAAFLPNQLLWGDDFYTPDNAFGFDGINLYELQGGSPVWPWDSMGTGVRTYTIVPEPTAGLLALVGAATLLLRRRRR